MILDKYSRTLLFALHKQRQKSINGAFCNDELPYDKLLALIKNDDITYGTIVCLQNQKCILTNGTASESDFKKHSCISPLGSAVFEESKRKRKRILPYTLQSLV